MNSRFSVLCPIDFSEPSRAALSYAATIADHFGAHLTVLAVDDPLLAEVAARTGRVPTLEDETRDELRRFAGQTLDWMGTGPRTVDFRVTVGKPAPEILRVARELGSDLVVISSRGRTGVRKMFFGSTTERVLRETTVPVLVTPDEHERTLSVSKVGDVIRRILVPVDFVPATAHQLAIAAGIGQALSIPLLLAHIMEPIYIPPSIRWAMPEVDAGRRTDLEERLEELAAPYRARTAIETLLVTGEPAEDIVKLADVRDAQLIVMGLHSSGILGPRMGSVTYRVLCLTRALVLAIPPKLTESSEPRTKGAAQTIA